MSDDDLIKNIKVCEACVQPEYCRNNAICHYTGSPMLEPDGSVREDWKIDKFKNNDKAKSKIENSQPSYKKLNLNDIRVCEACIQPEYCRNNVICHYTGSPMLKPDGSIYENWKKVND